MADENKSAPADDEDKPAPESPRPVYESNPKHSEPWQAGARGTLCDKDVRSIAQILLDESTLHGGARYAVHNGQAYCAREHKAGHWHGHPTGWREVPAKLRTHWVKEGRVKKRQIDKYWK